MINVLLIVLRRSALWGRGEFDKFGLEDRIFLEKVDRPEFKATRQRRHCRKIFLTWNMVESDGVPHHYIFILYFSIPVINIELHKFSPTKINCH